MHGSHGGAGDSEVRSLSLGGQHSSAVSALSAIGEESGTAVPKEGIGTGSKVYVLHTWGYGEFGVLGHGERLLEHFPRLVNIQLGVNSSEKAPELEELHAHQDLQEPQVSAGGTHTLVNDEAGRVFACGRDEKDSGVLGVHSSEIDLNGIADRLAQVRGEVQHYNSCCSCGCKSCIIVANSIDRLYSQI
jgi:hypothetical protein